MHGEAAVLRTHPRQCFIQTLAKQDAVGQPGHDVVMRHMGDARLGAPALGDVDDGDDLGGAVRIGQRA